MGWPQDAYVGQEIVCINLNNVTNPWHRANPLTIGETYKIVEINIGEHSGKLYFCVTDGTERYWMANQFRPVEKRKTDISIFTAMLGPKVKERM